MKKIFPQIFSLSAFLVLSFAFFAAKGFAEVNVFTDSIKAPSLCIGEDCKTAWSQVGGGSTLVGEYAWNAATLPTAFPGGIQSSFVSSSQGFQNYGSVMNIKTYSAGGGSLQLYTPYSETYGGKGLQVRFGNYDVSNGNSWTGWKTLLASDNFTQFTGTSYANGNVGIGTTTPSSKLEVTGNVLINGELSGGSAYGVSRIWADTLGSKMSGDPLELQYGVAGDVVVSGADSNLKVEGGGNSSFAGNVGVGTTTPTAKLDVAGNIKVDGAIVSPEGTLRDDGGGWIRTYGQTGWYSQTYGGGWYMTDGSWIRTYGDKNIYHNTGIMRTDGTLQVGPDGTTLNVANGGNFAYRSNVLFANTSGNVGVGTTAPAAKLDVAGGVKVGDDTATCDATKAGTLRFQSPKLQVCNGTTWIDLGSVTSTGSLVAQNLNSGETVAYTTDRFKNIIAPNVLSMGGMSGCAIVNQEGNNVVKCWGYNAYGQLGVGDSTHNRYTPVVVQGITNAVKITTGYTFACALLSDKTVKCWGYNPYGEFGNGTATSSSIPVLNYMSNVTDISAGTYQLCAVLQNGTIQCSGYNAYGQLGNGTATSTANPTPQIVSGISTATSVKVGEFFACAILTDRTVRCWGNNTLGGLGNGSNGTTYTPVVVSGISTATKISLGKSHACAILADKTVKCWGRGSEGQLGNNAGATSYTPVVVSGISTAEDLATGEYHSCAVLTDKTVKCWGYNSYGQIGNNSTTIAYAPVLVSNLSGVNSVATAQNSTCAVKADGAVNCWGHGLYGVLSNASANSSYVPALAYGFSKPVQIDAGPRHTCYVHSDGVALCSGYNGSGELGNGTNTNFTVPWNVLGINQLVQVTTGQDHTCGLKYDGSVYCWGYNVNGQLGNGSTTGSITPVAVSGMMDAAWIEAGVNNTCALHHQGTIQCWGNNDYGKLGNPNVTAANLPTATYVQGVSTAIDLSVGIYHSCAALASGQVQCWGYNGYGQLGDGTTSNRTAPVTVSGISTAKKVAVGAHHSCAVLADGTAKCWGRGTEGQIGDNTSYTRYTPVSVAATLGTASDITAGTYSTCALLSNKTVKCWGYNNTGQLGNGSVGTTSTPTSVPGLGNVKRLEMDQFETSYYGNTCAVTEEGYIYCWGYNVYGNHGTGDATARYSPFPMRGMKP